MGSYLFHDCDDLKIAKQLVYKPPQENSNFKSFKRKSNPTSKLENKKANKINMSKVIGTLSP